MHQIHVFEIRNLIYFRKLNSLLSNMILIMLPNFQEKIPRFAVNHFERDNCSDSFTSDSVQKLSYRALLSLDTVIFFDFIILI